MKRGLTKISDFQGYFMLVEKMLNRDAVVLYVVEFPIVQLIAVELGGHKKMFYAKHSLDI